MAIDSNIKGNHLLLAPFPDPASDIDLFDKSYTIPFEVYVEEDGSQSHDYTMESANVAKAAIKNSDYTPV